MTNDLKFARRITSRGAWELTVTETGKPAGFDRANAAERVLLCLAPVFCDPETDEPIVLCELGSYGGVTVLLRDEAAVVRLEDAIRARCAQLYAAFAARTCVVEAA